MTCCQVAVDVGTSSDDRLFVGALHVVATDVSPVRRTISEYALGEYRWAFDTGVLGLCVGSALVLVALVRAGLLAWPSPGAVAFGVWPAALVVIVVFEKTNRAVGPSVGGVIHRYASLVAFLSVPVTALVLGRRWRDDATWGRFAAVSRTLGVLALVVLGAILVRIALRRVSGVSELVPLGLAERVLAIIEVATVALFALWSLRPVAAPQPTPRHRRPPLRELTWGRSTWVRRGPFCPWFGRCSRVSGFRLL